MNGDIFLNLWWGFNEKDSGGQKWINRLWDYGRSGICKKMMGSGIFPYLAILGTKAERARIFGQINLPSIWSSELISAYKKVISITGDLNALSGRVNINLRL